MASSQYNKCEILTVLVCGGWSDPYRPVKRFYSKGAPIYYYNKTEYLNMINNHGFGDGTVRIDKEVSKVKANDLSWFGLPMYCIGKTIMEVRLY